MKINKDLVDAFLMLSCIILVLIGTSDFENETLRTSLMGGLAFVAVIMLVLRVLGSRNKSEDNALHH